MRTLPRLRVAGRTTENYAEPAAVLKRPTRAVAATRSAALLALAGLLAVSVPSDASEAANVQSWTGQANSKFGEAVAPQACDVTGDGRPDLLVGASNWSTSSVSRKGATFIVPNGTEPTNVDESTPGVITVEGPDTGRAFSGYSVACLGDVNGDGTGDLGIGEYNTGHAYVVFGGKNIPGKLQVDQLGDHGFAIAGDRLKWFGYQVSGVGDVNGDGLADIAVNNYNGGIGGFVDIIPGQRGTDTVDSSQESRRIARINSSRDRSLTDVQPAGDVNGDGVDDIVIGGGRSKYVGSAENRTGVAWVIFGRSAGRIDLDSGFPGFLVQGPSRGFDRIGMSVAAAGDIDGDGYDDLLISADGEAGKTTAGESVTRPGGAVLVRGSDSKETVSTDPSAPGGKAVWAGNTDRGWWLDAADPNAHSGYHVAARKPSGPHQSGTLLIGGSRNAVYAVDTRALTGSAATGAPPGAAVQKLQELPSELVRIHRGTTGENEVNNGVGILENYGSRDAPQAVVGAYTALGSVPRVDMFPLPATGSVTSTAAPVPTAVPSTTPSTPAVPTAEPSTTGATETGTPSSTDPAYTPVPGGATEPYLTWVGQPNSQLGQSVAKTSCDFTGDGKQDVVTSAWTWTAEGKRSRGAVYVIPNGSEPADVNDPKSPVIRIDGPMKDSGYLGYQVNCAGDVNGDGIDDIVISDNYAQSAHVVYGARNGATRLSIEALGDGGLTIRGASGENSGVQVNRVGDLNGDGLQEIGIASWSANGGGGRIYVVDGSSRGEINLQSGQGVMATVNGSRQRPVSSAAAAGDVNGDGKPDLVIGGMDAVPEGYSDTYQGMAWVLFGGLPRTTVLDQGFEGFAVNGPERGRDRLGMSVSALGDIDHDGKDDLVIGADGVRAVVGGVLEQRPGGAAVVLGSDSHETVRTDPSATSGRAVWAGSTDRGWWLDADELGSHAGFYVSARPASGTNESGTVLIGGSKTAAYAVDTRALTGSTASGLERGTPVLKLSEITTSLATSIHDEDGVRKLGGGIGFARDFNGRDRMVVGGINTKDNVPALYFGDLPATGPVKKGNADASASPTVPATPSPSVTATAGPTADPTSEPTATVDPAPSTQPSQSVEPVPTESSSASVLPSSGVPTTPEPSASVAVPSDSAGTGDVSASPSADRIVVQPNASGEPLLPGCNSGAGSSETSGSFAPVGLPGAGGDHGATATPQSEHTESPRDLASTGVRVTGLVLASVVLVGSGFLILGLRRRSRRH